MFFWITLMCQILFAGRVAIECSVGVAERGPGQSQRIIPGISGSVVILSYTLYTLMLLHWDKPGHVYTPTHCPAYTRNHTLYTHDMLLPDVVLKLELQTKPAKFHNRGENPYLVLLLF